MSDRCLYLALFAASLPLVYSRLSRLLLLYRPLGPEIDGLLPDIQSRSLELEKVSVHECYFQNIFRSDESLRQVPQIDGLLYFSCALVIQCFEFSIVSLSLSVEDDDFHT